MKLTAPPLVDHYELERRIAVEVMGLPAVEFNERTKCPYCGVVGRWCGTRSRCCECQEWYYHPYKNYRDSMDDAMQVVEKLWQSGWQIEITNHHKMHTRVTDKVRVWHVRFVGALDCRDGWSDERESLPEAICHAAIKTLRPEG